MKDISQPSPMTYFSDQEPGPTVLIVDDEEGARRRLKMILSMTEEGRRIHVLFASSRPEALAILSKTSVHVVLLDKNLGPDEKDDQQNGIKAIDEMRLFQPHLQILVITGSRDTRDAVEAMKHGAFDYVTKELPDELLLCKINRAIEVAKVTFRQFRKDRMSSHESPELGGTSAAFRSTLERAQILAETNRPVLLLGETGTGKTELAHYIHKMRAKFYNQKERPFFKVDIGALAPEIVDRDLFGSERGAYTDAQMTQGFFELANNGTLFLDEIGEASLELQAKLLTVIESGDFFRLGSSRKLNSKPKIILATNRNLEEMVRAGTFRADLFYRINSFPIYMPPLSERREDIPDIVRALLPRICKDNNVSVRFEEIPGDFLEYLSKLPLEENIRGIQHQMDRLLVFAPKDSKRVPMMKNWRAIPGLYVTKFERKSEMQGSRRTNNLRDLLTLPWDVIGPEFPGLKAFLELVEHRVAADAFSKHKRNDARASALGVSAGHASRLVGRLKRAGAEVTDRAGRGSKNVSVSGVFQ